jgi:hypothetical protein
MALFVMCLSGLRKFSFRRALSALSGFFAIQRCVARFTSAPGLASDAGNLGLAAFALAVLLKQDQ